MTQMPVDHWIDLFKASIAAGKSPAHAADIADEAVDFINKHRGHNVNLKLLLRAVDVLGSRPSQEPGDHVRVLKSELWDLFDAANKLRGGK